MQPLLGAALTAVETTNVWGLPLGTISPGPAGSLYMLVQAGGTIAQYDVVSVTSAGSAVALTKALADAGRKIGVAQVAIANGSFGWVLVKGVGRANVLASAAADAALYTTATAGSLDDEATSQTLVRGLRLTTARAASNGDAPCVMVIEPFAG